MRTHISFKLFTEKSYNYWLPLCIWYFLKNLKEYSISNAPNNSTSIKILNATVNHQRINVTNVARKIHFFFKWDYSLNCTNITTHRKKSYLVSRKNCTDVTCNIKFFYYIISTIIIMLVLPPFHSNGRVSFRHGN